MKYIGMGYMPCNGYVPCQPDVYLYDQLLSFICRCCSCIVLELYTQLKEI